MPPNCRSSLIPNTHSSPRRSPAELPSDGGRTSICWHDGSRVMTGQIFWIQAFLLSSPVWPGWRGRQISTKGVNRILGASRTMASFAAARLRDPVQHQVREGQVGAASHRDRTFGARRLQLDIERPIVGQESEFVRVQQVLVLQQMDP